jgi:hypothetical protein
MTFQSNDYFGQMTIRSDDHFGKVVFGQTLFGKMAQTLQLNQIWALRIPAGIPVSSNQLVSRYLFPSLQLYQSL